LQNPRADAGRTRIREVAVAGRLAGHHQIQGSGDGYGPLLERDYWAVINRAGPGPVELIEALARRFPQLAPPDLVRFVPPGQGALAVGDELGVRITGAGEFGVRVVHRAPQSITLATLRGHPEAGRITFGAYHNSRGDVIFHIRSRARASSPTRLLGFLVAGDPMQTNTWTDFINRVASTFGRGVRGRVYAEKRAVESEPGDVHVDRPTFIAVQRDDG
jgi:hypothetical protein